MKVVNIRRFIFTTCNSNFRRDIVRSPSHLSIAWSSILDVNSRLLAAMPRYAFAVFSYAAIRLRVFAAQRFRPSA